MRSSFSYTPPPLGVLSTLDNDQLCHVAKLIAKNHYFKQRELCPNEVGAYLHTRHEYGLELVFNASKTEDGLMARLRRESFWRERVNAAADFHREHLAMRSDLLGDPENGMSPYCSDATYKMFESRSLAITSKMSERTFDPLLSITKASLYRDSQRARFNQLYISGKAMVALAHERAYSWALVTLTCPPSFHPSSPNYDGSSFKDGNDYITSMYRKLFKDLGKVFKANNDYFGIRVVEAHLDGCPHWHIVLFSTDAFFSRLIKKLKSIYSASKRPPGYFEQYQNEIVKLSTNGDFQGTPLSYICKHLAFGLQRMRSCEDNIASKRNLYAIKSAGVKQFEPIGANGLATKLKALRKVARSHGAPEHLKAIAAGLVQEPTQLGRETQLSGVVKLLNNQLNDIELIRVPTLNRYGEQSTKLAAVRHKRDLMAHSFCDESLPNCWGGAITLNDLSIEGNIQYEPAQPPRLSWAHSQAPKVGSTIYQNDTVSTPAQTFTIMQYVEFCEWENPTRMQWHPCWLSTIKPMELGLSLRCPGNQIVSFDRVACRLLVAPVKVFTIFSQNRFKQLQKKVNQGLKRRTLESNRVLINLFYYFKRVHGSQRQPNILRQVTFPKQYGLNRCRTEFIIEIE